jgi:hypothetical protein
LIQKDLSSDKRIENLIEMSADEIDELILITKDYSGSDIIALSN